MRRLRDWSRRWWGPSDTPDREAIIAAFDKLKPLPEADRMQTGPKVRRTPRTFNEWAVRHDARKRERA